MIKVFTTFIVCQNDIEKKHVICGSMSAIEIGKKVTELLTKYGPCERIIVQLEITHEKSYPVAEQIYKKLSRLSTIKKRKK